jgi:hypothetical protein
MEEADPMCMVIRKVVREHVERGWVVHRGDIMFVGADGRDVRATEDRVDSIKRSRLLGYVRSEAGRGGSLEMRGQSTSAKRRLDAEMMALGYRYQDTDVTVMGVRVKDCYLGCREVQDADGGF